MKVKEKQIKKIIPKQIKKIVNNKKSKPLEQRKNCINHKLQISKTLSMETISTGPKYTTRQKSSISDKLFNNTMEEIDYLNFSDIDIDLIKKISSCEKDIFKPNISSKNEENKKEIVQNRYNMIDTSFDTNQQEDIFNKNGDEYVELNKNILIKTPSTICNYYDIESDKKNIKTNKNEEKNNKKIKSKQIQLSNNSLSNYNNNNPSYTNRIKKSKYYSSSNISLNQNSKRNFNKTNATFYKNKKNRYQINLNKTKNYKKEIIAPILKKRNLEIKSKMACEKINDKKNNNMKSSLNNTNKTYKNKTHSNQTKKSLYIKQYSEYITSQVIKKEKDKSKSNCNFTFNNDITLYLKRQNNIQDFFDSIKEIKETITNKLDENVSDESEDNKEIQKIQKPIMLCLNKPKFNSYFKTPKNLSSSKKEKKQINSVCKNKNLHIDKCNIMRDNYTGRNYHKSCRTSNNNIVVKRKKKDSKNNIRECYINFCSKSINSNQNKKINNNNSTKKHITFHNYINDCLDKPIIKVNLKKHIKSSSQIMKFINVNSKNSKQKIKNNSISSKSEYFSNNKSFIKTGSKRARNTSQLIKDLLTKKSTIKSPLKINNNNSMIKTSKTMKENSVCFISKIKSSKQLKEEKISTNKKRNLVKKNNIKYYSIKYEINPKNNGNTKFERNKDNKINAKTNEIQNKFVKQKTQSDIKVNKYKKIEEKNRENLIKKENEDYGLNRRVKQKLLDRMNKVTKNTFGNIRKKKKNNDNFSDIMKSPFKNKEYSITHKNFYNKKLISNENSKNEEKDIKKEKIEKRNQFELKIIKDYRGSNTYNNIF